MRAQLILEAENGGRREGRLRNGAYLVGRSRSCQIRPPFRSISRRHCILLNLPHRLSVVDLGSSAGTFINGNLIAPGVEAELQHGDELRVGDVAFQLAIFTDELPEFDAVPAANSVLEEALQPAIPSPPPTQRTPPKLPTVPLSGNSNEINPLGGDDVADWLLGLDETDRGERMHAIKKKFNLSDDAAADDADDDGDFEIDASIDTGEQKADQGNKSNKTKAPAEPHQPVAQPASKDNAPGVNRAAPHTSNHEASNREGPEATGPETTSAPKRSAAPARSRSGPGFVSGFYSKIKENPDSFKLILLTLGAVIVFSWAAFYTYSTFFAGPSVEVFTDI